MAKYNFEFTLKIIDISAFQSNTGHNEKTNKYIYGNTFGNNFW